MLFDFLLKKKKKGFIPGNTQHSSYAGIKTSTGTTISLSDAYDEVGVVAAILNIISNIVSRSENVFYKGDKKIEDTQKIEDIIKKMFGFSVNEVKKISVLHADIFGMFAWLKKENKEIDILYPENAQFRSGVYRFGYNKVYDRDSLILGMYPDPKNPYVGYPPMRSAEDIISSIYYYYGKIEKQQESGITSIGVLLDRAEGVVEGKDLEAKSDIINSRMTQHKIPVVGNMDFQPIDESGIVVAELEQIKHLERQLYSIFSLPPVFMGDYENANYSNSEIQERLAKVNCFLPRLGILENAFNQVLAYYFPLMDYRVEFKLADIFEDEEKKTSIQTQKIASGILTINEARQIEGLEEVQDGDVPIPLMRIQQIRSMYQDEVKDFIKDLDKKYMDIQGKNIPQKRRMMKEKEKYRHGLEIQFLSDSVKSLKKIKKTEMNIVKDILGLKKDKDISSYQRELENIYKLLILGLLDRAENDLLSYLQTFGWSVSADAIQRARANLVDPSLFSDMASNDVKNMQTLIEHGFKEGMAPKDIARMIDEKIDMNLPHRANSIARTESGKMALDYSFETEKELGFSKQEWLSALAENTRANHEEMHGQIGDYLTGFVMLSGPDAVMKHPLDASASAGNIVNCMCRAIPIEE